jgi:hypothetical protein
VRPYRSPASRRQPFAASDDKMYMYVVPRGPAFKAMAPHHLSTKACSPSAASPRTAHARGSRTATPPGPRPGACLSPSAPPALGSQFPAVHAHRERDRNFLSSSAGNGPGRTYARYERWKEGRKKSLHPLYFTLLHRSLSESAQSDVRDARRRERCTAEGTGRARLDIESAFCCSYALCGGVMSS